MLITNRGLLSWIQLPLFCVLFFGLSRSGARRDMVSIGNTTTSTSANAQPFSTSSIGMAQSFYYASDFTLTGLDLNLYNLGASNTGTYTI